jgi:hypothetical protein
MTFFETKNQQAKFCERMNLLERFNVLIPTFFSTKIQIEPKNE